MTSSENTFKWPLDSGMKFDLIEPDSLKTYKYNYIFSDMLKYHVVQGTIYSEGLKSGPLTSYTGQTLHVHVNHSKY
jgi:uncharacterized surface protein with fasciclin (FAS1) repeats